MIWFVEKKYETELDNENIFETLGKLVKEGKAIEGARLGKSSLGYEFNRQYSNDENYITIQFINEF